MTLLHRMHARDRALFEVLLLPHQCAAGLRTTFTVLTHVGGATATVMLALLPLMGNPAWQFVGRHAILTLVLSHVLVQFAKRLVGRGRPSAAGLGECFVAEPDRFSFPSGHATASLAVALAYTLAFPALAVPILALATLVGISRVVLGVHYPGDVAAGQALAVATHLLLLRFGA